MKSYMNPQHGKLMHEAGLDKEAAAEHESPEQEAGEQGEKPQIFVHSHEKGHSVHVHHSSGEHSVEEYEPGDAEGVAHCVAKNLGGKYGQ